MESRALWIAFFITIQFSAVLGSNPFYEYFYNKYHLKDNHSSTAEEISSVSENNDTSMTPPTLQYGDYYNNRYQDTQNAIIVITAITIGCFVFLVLCSWCLFLCVWRCRINTVVRGRVITLNTTETATRVPPEQHALDQQRVLDQKQQKPVVLQQYLQAVTTQQQQFPSGHMENPPPYSELHPVQQQHPPTLSSQSSPTQDHSPNPPNAPPAYDFPEKFE